MWWISRSLYSVADTLLRPGVSVEPLDVSVVVWQTLQPMELNRLRPLLMEVAPPGVVVEGTGGASNRMNMANDTVSLSVPTAVVLKLVWSSGVGLSLHCEGRPVVWSSFGRGRSCVNSSLLTPISTL